MEARINEKKLFGSMRVRGSAYVFFGRCGDSMWGAGGRGRFDGFHSRKYDRWDFERGDNGRYGGRRGWAHSEHWTRGGSCGTRSGR
jgi:hypothetical protein